MSKEPNTPDEPTDDWDPTPLRDAVPPPPPGKQALPSPQPIEQNEDPVRALFDTLGKVVVNGEQLRHLKLPVREFIVRPFFKVADLGFIFGVRGEGKTWLGLLIAVAIAGGKQMGWWPTTKPRRIVYADGEMPLGDIQQRLNQLGGSPENLLLLHHELLFQHAEQSLNFANPVVQAAVTDYLVSVKAEGLILDNLSALFFGLKENDADGWEAVLPWLLDLRRRGIAVVVVAHAGRNGQIRGTSKREDHAFWIIKVEKIELPAGDPRFRFRTSFEKNRNEPQQAPVLEWTLKPTGADGMDMFAVPVSKQLAVLRLIADGMTSPGEIAQELGVTKGRVSQMVGELIRDKDVRKQGREYELTECGRARLAAEGACEREVLNELLRPQLQSIDLPESSAPGKVLKPPRLGPNSSE